MSSKATGSKYIALKSQIAALEAAAADARAKESKAAVAQIRQWIAEYGLNAGDLGLGTKAGASANGARAAQGQPGKASKASKAGKPVKTGKSTRAAKFSDGAGNSWSGIGKRPNWFKTALAAGKTPQELMANG